MKNISILLLFLLNIFNNFSLNFSIVYNVPAIEDENYWWKKSEDYINNLLIINNIKIEKKVKNLIIFIGDGMGMSTITSGRIYKGQKKEQSGEEENLIFDLFPNIGLAKTYNIDKQVPDSAGTATALFTGVKTRYGVIGMSNASISDSLLYGRLSSIFDWGIADNKRTGFITTTRVTHATPAALYAKSPDRDWECDTLIPEIIKKKNNYQIKDIAEQLINEMPGKRINLIMGGGRSMFGLTPKTITMDENDELYKINLNYDKLCYRTDKRNLINEWLANHNNEMMKKKFLSTRDELINLTDKQLNEYDYLFGLFNDNHMSYNALRNYTDYQDEPSLSEMTTVGLKLLNNKMNTNGLMLMVESGRIDHGHHKNLGHLALDELLEFDKTINMTLEYLKVNNLLDETLVIVTADHSHSLTLNGYPVRGNNIFDFANKKNIELYETLSYTSGPGYYEHLFNQSECTNRTNVFKRDDLLNLPERENIIYRNLAAFPLKDAAHTGEDVPVYARGYGSNLFNGVFEQNYIAYAIGYLTCTGPPRLNNRICINNHNYNVKSSGVSLTSAFNMIIFLIIYYLF